MVYFAKSQQAPGSLAVEKRKANGSYRQEDVLAQLQNDFHNKCYLCEQKEPTSINIEHFAPHRNDKDLKFDWNNLFFACFHCNNIKSDKFENILNCTVAEDGVDTKIRYAVNSFPKETVMIEAVEKNNEKVVGTVELLNAIYHGTTDIKRLESHNLRKKIVREINEFRELLLAYVGAQDNKAALKRQIEEHLLAASAFTAFKRWIIRDNETLRAEFSW
jgi:uncharacterized protein (TIGR02646 family)